MPRSYVVRRSSIQGKGLFATRRIKRGTRLIEYTGEHITNAEAARRYPDDPSVPHHTFLFQVTSRDVIDAGSGGNTARYINHSCDPNCESTIEGRRVWIEAIRDIEPGEELLYDYRYVIDGRHTKKEKARYACRCGSPLCRGTILYPKKKRR